MRAQSDDAGPALVARDTMLAQRGTATNGAAPRTARPARTSTPWPRSTSGAAGPLHVLDRLAVYAANDQTEPGLLPERLLDAADRLGFDQLLAEHRAAWARRWDAVDVRIAGDPEAQLAVRFALFHLMAHAGRRRGRRRRPRADRPGLPRARVLGRRRVRAARSWPRPIRPRPGRCCEYRLRPAARGPRSAPTAPAGGRPVPVGVGDRGRDVTPAIGARPGGRLVPIAPGARGAHRRRRRVGGLRATPSGPGRRFPAGPAQPSCCVETARYWASPVPRGRRRPRLTSTT